jgi:hypothetical protein
MQPKINYGLTTVAVKITFPTGHARSERGFRTTAEAQTWIDTEREREATARRIPPRRPA